MPFRCSGSDCTTQLTDRCVRLPLPLPPLVLPPGGRGGGVEWRQPARRASHRPAQSLHCASIAAAHCFDCRWGGAVTFQLFLRSAARGAAAMASAGVLQQFRCIPSGLGLPAATAPLAPQLRPPGSARVQPARQMVARRMLERPRQPLLLLPPPPPGRRLQHCPGQLRRRMQLNQTRSGPAARRMRMRTRVSTAGLTTVRLCSRDCAGGEWVEEAGAAVG